MLLCCCVAVYANLRQLVLVRLQGSNSGFRVQGSNSGFRVQGSGFEVQGLGFKVWGLDLRQLALLLAPFHHQIQHRPHCVDVTWKRRQNQRLSASWLFEIPKSYLNLLNPKSMVDHELSFSLAHGGDGEGEGGGGRGRESERKECWEKIRVGRARKIHQQTHRRRCRRRRRRRRIRKGTKASGTERASSSRPKHCKRFARR